MDKGFCTICVHDRLIALPGEIRKAGTSVVEAQHTVMKAQRALDKKKADLLLDPTGPIDGKNAEIRAAQMDVRTKDEQDALEAAKIALEICKMDLSALHSELQALVAVAGLMSASKGE